MTFWNEELETMPADKLKEMQFRLLQNEIKTMYGKSAFFRKRMDSVGLKPEDITDMEQFRKIPCMKKTDLRDNYPDGLFVVPYDDLVRVHVSSGTTGKPTVVGYTQKDIDNWTESLARGMTSFGAGKKDVMQNMHGYGLFTGGLGVHYAGERIGATVIPTGVGNTDRQIQLMQDLPVTFLAGTPSYMFHIADICDQKGIDIRRDTKVRKALCGGEPWSESMRKKLYDRTGIKAYSCYGASEFYGPMFLECSEQAGMHVWADLALVEILDKEGNPVPDGEQGEVVVTMLQKEAFPLIRYKIGDISSITWEKCKCGRTHPRLGRITGRADDMIVVRGINVFPSQVESVIGEMPFLAPFYHITLTNPNYMDKMVVDVEILPECLPDMTDQLDRMTQQVVDRMKEILNLKVVVKINLPNTLERCDGKSKHVTDNRSWD
ncbi:MAG: phenylacetate--CoA ligase [Candidatus Methanomethylophilus sp.]|jgi:phenylacetate-CoA ligase|nr:phenylacetate--CoA ligase [Methanomethylophilus sp.]MCI2074327.1 phenylacetate--CoA ligase [Methanomethylophilus sp.]MCI2092876.1 phenylacetate--CoA ligase [Methanomethylophilus sp.]